MSRKQFDECYLRGRSAIDGIAVNIVDFTKFNFMLSLPQPCHPHYPFHSLGLSALLSAASAF
jgi:hypothetical protein